MLTPAQERVAISAFQNILDFVRTCPQSEVQDLDEHGQPVVELNSKVIRREMAELCDLLIGQHQWACSNAASWDNHCE